MHFLKHGNRTSRQVEELFLYARTLLIANNHVKILCLIVFVVWHLKCFHPNQRVNFDWKLELNVNNAASQREEKIQRTS